MNDPQAGALSRLRKDVALAPLTTIRIGGVAGAFFEPETAEDLARALPEFEAAGLEWRALGGGSNLLVTDARIGGVVVHPAKLRNVEICGQTVTAGAGCSLSALIAMTTDAGLAGLDVLAGIPGQVGGAVAMNAGGRFGEIGQSVLSVDLAFRDGHISTLGASELCFGYRHSEIPAGAIVVRVAFALRSGDRRELKKRAGAILKEKNAAQPTTAWNFGCMFKNPPGQSAGRLVESCGLKGATLGGARISPLHGNFVENVEHASCRDVLGLIEMIEHAVRDRHGVVLEREVRVWES
jgi:UDP-N-acetylmuramate dehydrogenase